MSQQFRPNPGGGAPVSVPTGVQCNVREGVPPFIYGSARIPYNITAVPMIQGFPTATPSYPPQIPNAQSRFNLVTVPRTQQRIYVPLQQVPRHPYATPAGVPQMIPSDPGKLIEEQRKLEKERNFQLQQQRLKQFTVAGKKGSLNADNLLDGMFGKPDAKRSSAKANKVIDPLMSSAVPTVPQQTKSKTRSTEFKKDRGQGDISTKKSEVFCKERARKDPKELENMMMQCSNLSGPLKAKTFQKPLVKEVTRTNKSGTTFSSSQKAVDWGNIQGLDNVFTAPKPRFPQWCKKGSVPLLYQEVENLVVADGDDKADTSRLYPILVSSGLPQVILGEIWEMVNRTSTEGLTLEEMYAALSLIAVAQAGHQVKSIDVLHQLISCPVPVLTCFAQQQQQQSVTSQETTANAAKSGSATNLPHVPVIGEPVVSASDSVRPSSLAYVDGVTNCVSSWKPFDDAGSGTTSADDGFGDFKSATPMAINAPPLVESVPSSGIGDDYDEFKRADAAFEKFKDQMPASDPLSIPPFASKPINADRDLMEAEEDKYSIFRTLQQDISDPCTSAESVGLVGDCPSLLLAREDGNEQEEFGDFVDANDASASIKAAEISTSANDASFTANFADFSQLNTDGNVSNNPVFLRVGPQAVVKVTSDDSEFGEFAACHSSAPKLDASQDYFFHCGKDNISLAESQSISSLELGTFDGAGHSGDSKSSLSRQGSIPSLDLKVVNLEVADPEDSFGEMQSAVIPPSPSPSVQLELKNPEEKFSAAGLHAQPYLSAPLTDKYSVIRSEQVIHEDQHIGEWTRCVRSCLEILQNATKIFNQMSCSSVCNEVLNTEEGKNYVQNVVEVYRVVCRVSLASKSYEKQNNKLLQLIEDSDQSFHSLSIFLAGSPHMPEDTFLDFSSGVLRADLGNNEKACGVCLLNVDSRSKAFDKPEDKNKLTYGGRQYHSTCANLWVNCVDPLLPVLTLPQLI